jgi:hypothetical protein
MSVKVELGFTPAGENAPFFELDDPIKGVLDSTTYVLGGEVLADVTQYVRSFNIDRGKSRELDRYTAGGASVQFNNDTRVFDPAYTLSPYYGQIQPKRRIRISVDDIVQFDGTVWDWNIQYDLGGFSVAIAVAYDATQLLNNINLTEYVSTAALSGTQINDALDAISWDPTNRDIDRGSLTMAAGTVTSNLYDYLQAIAVSEPGDLFVSKDGKVKFVDRFSQVTGDTPEFTDDGTGLPYSSISAQIGSELLYNNITVTNATGTATATNELSIENYGEIDYELATLVADNNDLQPLADFLRDRYSEPRYRIDAIAIALNKLSSVDRAKVLNLDLGDVVAVTFTPSGIPPAIVSYVKVIGIGQSIQPQTETITLRLEALSGVVLVLDDPEFGKLDSGYFLSGPYNAWTLNDPIYGRLSAGMAVS